MRKLYVSTLLVILCLSTTMASQKDKGLVVHKWLNLNTKSINLPAFHSNKDMNGSTYQLKNLLQEEQLDLKSIKPSSNDFLNWIGEKLSWNEISANAKGYLGSNKANNSISYYINYISVDKWLKTNIDINTNAMLEVYVDGKKILSNYQDETKELSKEIKLEVGKYCILVKVLNTDKKNDFKFSLEASNDWSNKDLKLSISPKQFMTINKVLDGKKVNNIQLSEKGDLALISYSRTLPPSDKSENWKEIQEISSGKILYSFRGSNLSGIKWLPTGRKISYTKNYNSKTSIFTFDFEQGIEKEVANNISDFSSYTWSPNEEYMIYSIMKNYSEDWKIRKFQGMEDRLPWFRIRSFLYKLDVESGVKERLTYGSVSTDLYDIREDGKKILISQSRPDYNEFPYSKQNLYQMDVETFEIDTIWKDKLFSGYAQYSPDGSKLLVQAGPSCFGKIGENIGKQKMVNNYDGQLFIYELESKNIDPITYNFNPSVSNAEWNKTDNSIYIKAADKDYVRVFKYKPENKQFNTLSIDQDVVRGFSLSSDGQKMAYTACSISSPYKAFIHDTNSTTNQLISNPQKENLKDVTFGKSEDWNFTKEDGKTIIGRVYYPPNFDATKKYPVIVNYYAGTSPVERSFGGRYPLNLYASMGYVVYLLQPSGAIGFGQEFSAEHQNNWGITTADEIIQGTKKFLEAHPFTDAKNVGCIGASYGGFMTMLLQTRTDIFAAAISHAGISDITSYWGEGYWGYSYSTNASGKSFPWNNRKLYIDQSPLFNANKVVTPILLLHGSVDTNVPLGESIQMYQALKLLGKDVDFIQVKNQDHHIKNYTQRILWNNTIFAYFAKHLKNQQQWWEDMYPDKNL